MPLRGKGIGYLLCEAPFGPFRQKVPDPFPGHHAIMRDNFCTGAYLEFCLQRSYLS
jgi:hypothetical protein